MASFFIVLALYLQEGRGMSALGSGAIFMAVGAGYLAASLVPARISARLGRQWPALGGVVMAAGYAVLGVMVTGGGAGHVAALTGPLLITGAGMGMLTAPLTGIVLAQVMPQHAGTVSGLQATTVQLGNSRRRGGHRGRVLRRAGRRFRARLRCGPGRADRAAAGRRRRHPVPAAPGAALSRQPPPRASPDAARSPRAPRPPRPGWAAEQARPGVAPRAPGTARPA